MFDYKEFKKEMSKRGHEVHKNGKYLTIIPSNNKTWIVKYDDWIMGTIISIVFLVLMFAFWRSSKEEEARKRRDMYNNLNKKSVDEMDKWRR